MSYDYMLFRTTEPVETPEQFGPDTVAKIAPEELMAEIDGHLPGTRWSKVEEDTSAMPPDPEFQPPEAVWSGEYRDADERWLGFQLIVRAGACDCLHVKTSSQTDDSERVAALCTALGMTGLDGQKMALIQPGG